MSNKEFPQRPLHKPLQRNSAADPQDVMDVKIFLQDAGFYKIPSYGMTPYPDEALFQSIKDYQKQKGLHVDGAMNINGETQDQMRIDKEELPSPKKMIPGTNIPDEGVPEQGWPKSLLDDFDKPEKYNIDPNFEKRPSELWMDPDILIPSIDPKHPRLKAYKHKDT